MAADEVNLSELDTIEEADHCSGHDRPETDGDSAPSEDKQRVTSAWQQPHVSPKNGSRRRAHIERQIGSAIYGGVLGFGLGRNVDGACPSAEFQPLLAAPLLLQVNPVGSDKR